MDTGQCKPSQKKSAVRTLVTYTYVEDTVNEVLGEKRNYYHQDWWERVYVGLVTVCNDKQ